MPSSRHRPWRKTDRKPSCGIAALNNDDYNVLTGSFVDISFSYATVLLMIPFFLKASSTNDVFVYTQKMIFIQLPYVP